MSVDMFLQVEGGRGTAADANHSRFINAKAIHGIYHMGRQSPAANP